MPTRKKDADQDARLDALTTGLEAMKKQQGASDKKVDGLEKKVGEQATTIDEQKQALDGHAKKDVEQDAKIAKLEAQIEAQSLVDSAILMYAIASNNRSMAIDALQLELLTAPVSVTEQVKRALRMIVGTMFGFVSGALGPVLAKAAKLGGKAKPLSEGLKNAGGALAQSGLEEGMAIALADPDKPEVFFLAAKRAAMAQSAAILAPIQSIALMIPHSDDPLPIAQALHQSIARLSAGAYQAQYDATIGAYYQMLAAQDSVRPGLTPAMNQEIDPSERGASVKGVLRIEAKVSPRGAIKIGVASFDGAKTPGHEEYLRTTTIERLKVPIRLEIEEDDGEATIYRDAGGALRLMGDETWQWLNQRGKANSVSEPGLDFVPNILKEAAAIFDELGPQVVGLLD